MSAQRKHRLAPWTGLMALLILPGMVAAQSGLPPTGGPVTAPTENLPQAPERVLQPVPATPSSPAPPGTLPAPVDPSTTQPGAATGGQFQQPTQQPAQGPAGQPATAPYGQPQPRAGAERGGLAPDVQEVEGIIVELNAPGEALPLERLRIVVDMTQDWAAFSTESRGMADPDAQVPGFGRPEQPAPAPSTAPETFDPDALDLPAETTEPGDLPPAEPGDLPPIEPAEPGDLPPVEPGDLPPVEPAEPGDLPPQAEPPSEDGVDSAAACDLFFDPQEEGQDPAPEPQEQPIDLPPDEPAEPTEEQQDEPIDLPAVGEEAPQEELGDQAGNTMEFVITARTYIYSFERAPDGMAQAGLNPPQRSNFTNLHEGAFVALHYREVEEGVNEVVRLSMIRTPSGSASPAVGIPGSALGEGGVRPGTGAPGGAMTGPPAGTLGGAPAGAPAGALDGVPTGAIDPRTGGVPPQTTDENPLGRVNPAVPSRPPTPAEGSATGRPGNVIPPAGVPAPGTPAPARPAPGTPGTPAQPAVPGPGPITPPSDIPVVPNTPVPPVGP